MRRKNSRTVTTFLLALSLLVSSITASAAPLQAATVQPRYVGLATLSAQLDISSSGLAACYSMVNVRSGYTAEVTMELLQSPEGKNSWSEEKSWDTSGSGRLTIDEIWFVAPGYDYKVEVSVDVYNSSGRLVESPVKDSIIVSY